MAGVALSYLVGTYLSVFKTLFYFLFAYTLNKYTQLYKEKVPHISCFRDIPEPSIIACIKFILTVSVFRSFSTNNSQCSYPSAVKLSGGKESLQENSIRKMGFQEQMKLYLCQTPCAEISDGPTA